MNAGTLSIEIVANVARLSQDMAQAKGIVSGAMRDMDRVVAQFKSMLGSLGIALGAGMFAHLIKGSLEAQDSLAKLSQKVNSTVEELVGLEHAAQLSGAGGLDSVTKALKSVQTQAFDAAMGLAESKRNFDVLGISVTDANGALKGSPQLLLEVADKFQKMGNTGERTALAVKLFGKAGLDMIPMLAEGSAGIRAMMEEGQRLNPVTTESAHQAEIFNDNLLRLEKSLSAMGIRILNGVLPVASEMAKLFAEDALTGDVKKSGEAAGEAAPQFSLLANMLKVVVLAGGEISFVLKGVGREIGAWAAQLQSLSAAMNLLKMGQFSAAAKEFENFRNIGRLATSDAEAARKAFDEWFDKIVMLGTGAKDATPRVQGAAGALGAAGAAGKQAANDLEQLLAKIYAVESGFSPDLAKQISLLTEGFATGQLTATQFADAERALLIQQPLVTAATKAEADAIAHANDLRKAAQQAEVDEINARNELLDSLKDSEDALKAEVATLGMSDSQRKNYLDGLKMERELRTALADPNLTEQQAAAVEAEIRLRHSNIQATNTELEIAHQQAAVWNDIADAAGKFFSDLVMNGRSAFDNLKRYVKDLLAQMIALFAKRWILNMAAGGSVGGSAGQALSQVTGGGPGSSLLGTGLSMAGNAAATYFGYTGIGTAAEFVGAASGAIPAAAIGADAVAAGVGTNTVAAGIGSQVGTVLSAIPVYGWIALAVVAIAAWLSGRGGGPKTGGSFFGAFDASGSLAGNVPVPGTDNGRFFTPSDSDTQMQQAGQSFATGYVSTVRALGGTASAFTAGLGIDNDPHGSAQSRVSSMLQMGGRTIFSARDIGVDDKQVPAEVQHQLDQMLLAALQNSDLAPEIEKVLHSITDVAGATDEQIRAVLAQAQEMAGVLEGLKHLNLNLTEQDLEGFRVEGESIGQTFQRIAGQIGSFDSAFMSDAQKMQAAQSAVHAAFDELGTAIPDSAQGFYDLMHGLDLSTESGRHAFEVLMQVAPAFQAVQQASASMLGTFNSIMAQLRGAGFTQNVLQGSLSTALGQFQSTHNFASGWTSDYLLQQILTITPEDFANYLANDPQGAALINTILGTYAQMQQGAAGGGGLGPSGSPGLVDGPDATLAAAQNAAAEAARQLAEALKQAKVSLGQYMDGLLLNSNLSPLSPMEQLDEARRQFFALVAAARGGDLGALQQLQGASQAYLTIARQDFASSPQYVAIFKQVYDALAGVSGAEDYNARMLDLQASHLMQAQQQTSHLGEIYRVLIDIRDGTSAAVATITPQAPVPLGQR